MRTMGWRPYDFEHTSDSEHDGHLLRHGAHLHLTLGIRPRLARRAMTASTRPRSSTRILRSSAEHLQEAAGQQRGLSLLESWAEWLDKVMGRHGPPVCGASGREGGRGSSCDLAVCAQLTADMSAWQDRERAAWQWSSCKEHLMWSPSSSRLRTAGPDRDQAVHATCGPVCHGRSSRELRTLRVLSGPNGRPFHLCAWPDLRAVMQTRAYHVEHVHGVQ